MADILKIGVYGPTGSGKSLFILRWANPSLKMNEDDLTGNPFSNLYPTSTFTADVELIEHPSDDKIDPTENKFIIIANLIGWRDLYDQAKKLNPNGTFLVFTWADRPGSSTLSSKIHERHENVSSYSGLSFEPFKSLVINKRNAPKNKKKKVVDDDGWTKR